MVAAFQETKEFKVGDRVRGNWKAARNKFGKVARLYQKKSEQWVEVEWENGDSSKLRIDQLSPAGNLEPVESAEPVELVATEGGSLKPGDKVRILYSEGDDPHNQQWCDRVGRVNHLKPNCVQVDFLDRGYRECSYFEYSLVELVETAQLEPTPVPTRLPQEGDWVEGLSPTGTKYQGLVEGFSMSGMLRIRTVDDKRSLIDTTTAKLIDPPGTSETVSEVEELPILEAIATVEIGDQLGAFEGGSPGETVSLAAVEQGDQVDQLFAEINALDAQGTEAEQTAIAAGRAALEIRREQGRKLQEAKDQVVAAEGYGSWGKRFAAACPGIHIRTATNYMRLHREWEQITAQAGERLPELTLREAIALLQNKPALQAAPEPEPGPTFEELQQRFAPWGEFARTSDPKFKYSLDLPLPPKRYSFRSLKEADLFHQESCSDRNTIAARQHQQQQYLSQTRTCVSCKHRQLIGDGSEFRCNARGSEHGVTMNLAPECRHYKSRMMNIPGRVEAIAQCDPLSNTDAIAQPGSESVSEVEAELDAFVESMAPEPQGHPAGVLASSARNAKRAKTDEEAEAEAEKDERYTPSHITEAALKVCGADIFALDPATNSRTNPHVPCKVAYTKEDDGLQKDWSAETLWLNPPYSKMAAFVSKFIDTWRSERINHAFVLTKGDFSTQWCQRLLRTCSAVCLVNHRLTFEAPERELETSFFASLLFYFGPDVDEFVDVFDWNIGTVMVTPGAEPAAPVEVEGRAGLNALAESISLQEQRYAELIDECLQVGDRILLQGSLGKGKEWEVIGRDGDDVKLIGPFFDNFEPGERLLRDRDNPTTLHISEIRRIVTGGEA